MVKRENVFANYEITENGDVYSTQLYNGSRERRKLKLDMNWGGYLQIRIHILGRRKSIKIHRWVALQYLPPQPSPKHEIRHLDGNKLNNHVSNLAWGTRKENEADKLTHGRSNRGERHGMARLTIDRVTRIRLLDGKVEWGYWAKLSRALYISPATIYKVLHNKSWKNVEAI